MSPWLNEGVLPVIDTGDHKKHKNSKVYKFIVLTKLKLHFNISHRAGEKLLLYMQ